MKSLIKALEILKGFRNESEGLRLTDIVERSGLHKTTAHRMVHTLVEGGLLVRLDPNRYKLAIRPLGRKRFRVGYGMQSAEFSFSRAVSQSIQQSAAAADIDLLILDNEDLASRALHNADIFMKEGVNLVIESQTDARIAYEIALKFSSLSVPVIALEIPQPGAVFFGANNAQAGLIAGRHLARWAETHWKSTIDELILLELPKAGHIPNARILGSMLGVRERLAWVSQDQIKVLHTTGHFENAHTLLRRHLSRSKKRRILVAAINDPAALGALQAFRDLGREEHCAIVGHNASTEIHEEIRQKDSRLIGSVGYFPERYGEGVIPLALNLLEGRRTPNINFIKHEMITAQNFDSYYPD